MRLVVLTVCMHEPRAILLNAVEQVATATRLLNSYSILYPPTLFMHGEEDNLIPVGQSGRAASELNRLGVEAGVVVIPGVGHSLDWAWKLCY